MNSTRLTLFCQLKNRHTHKKPVSPAYPLPILAPKRPQTACNDFKGMSVPFFDYHRCTDAQRPNVAAWTIQDGRDLAVPLNRRG